MKITNAKQLLKQPFEVKIMYAMTIVGFIFIAWLGR